MIKVTHAARARTGTWASTVTSLAERPLFGTLAALRERKLTEMADY